MVEERGAQRSIQDGKPALSVFDLDRTLIRINSSLAFCYFLYRKKELPFSSLIYSGFYYLRHRFAGLTLPELHQKVFREFLFGRNLPDLEKHLEAFIAEIIAPKIYFPAFQALRQAQHLGHYTAIFSNSPDFLVAPIAQFFGVDFWKGSEYGIDKENRLCHISSVMQGADKATQLIKLQEKLHIGRDRVTVYSDSYLDLPFLQAGGMAIPVNPDRRLLRYSRKLQWKIL